MVHKASVGLLEVHDRTLEAYRSFVESFVRIADDRLRDFVQEKLKEGEFWPEPFLGLSPGYELGGTVDELAEEGLLHPTTAKIFRREDGSPFHLFRHQVEAIRRALAGKSFVLTSGTGSGKSFAYFIPIVDAVVRHPGLSGPVALVVYPMNALVNSQLKALEELKARYEARHGPGSFPLRFARYTGETDEDARRSIRNNPPHIILTNYVMGEYLLVRPDDRPLVSPPPSEAPFFLVFDELHTHRGRRGADVAMLVRRLRSRLPEGRKVVHIGTSATLVARKGARREERRQVVAEFATRFFGHPIAPEDVVEETLRPVTKGGPPTPEELRAGVLEPLPTEVEAFRRHPLARFLEWGLGLEEEAPGSYWRKTPRTLKDAAQELAQHAGLGLEEAQERLKETLLQATRFRDESGRPLFAPKLHQFISQTRSVYATLGLPERREFRMEPSPGDPPFFPLRFCRECGQEHYLVVKKGDGFYPHPEVEVVEGEEGYLTYWPEDLELPEEWLDDKQRVKDPWKKRQPQRVWVDEKGKEHPGHGQGILPMYWQPVPFTLCPRCGTYHSERVGEFRKLTYLGSEGRTSAASVLALSLLRSAKESLGEGRDKLLSFTDNRQDASLQAGHFNDFVRAVLLRAGLRKALEKHGELRHPDPVEISEATLEAMDLPLDEYAQTPQLNPESAAGRRAREVMRKVLLYRLYEDLRREWRFTQPNLEDVGLLEMGYRDLDNPRLLESLLQRFPGLETLGAEQVLNVLKQFMEVLRKKLAVDASLFREDFHQLRRQSEEHLNEFWALGEDDQPLAPATLVLGPATQGKGRPKGQELRLSYRSRLGKLLRGLGLGEGDYPAFVSVLVEFGLLKPVEGGYRIPESALIWRKGDPKSDVNSFFLGLYRMDPRELLGLEAREHTAQVVAPGERERRERRFRYTEEDRRNDPTLRRLPFLVASPTLELGVDIADLDMVHLRNIPPTPANYAQRSGRAGRQGQMGLILAFAGAYNHHDQYFFRHREEMVAGSVRAPSLDLANEALLKAHIQAEWLASTGLPLHDSIAYVVNTGAEHYPLFAEVENRLILAPEVRQALMERLWRVLEPDLRDLEKEGFDWAWVQRVVEEAPQEFDRAFDRWRNLYRAVIEDLEAAQRDTLHLPPSQERKEAERREKEALRQRDLLENQGSFKKEEGDFYPYRYLATEGFLPGYGFPTLPVTAWVPRGEGEFIQRPRPLALREMAPGNLIYHEGAKWVPRRFLNVPGGLASRVLNKKQCPTCGALANDTQGVCSQCGKILEGAPSLTALEFANVALKRRERITANEEERVRAGYKVVLGYDLSGIPDYRKRRARGEAANKSFRLLYAPSAHIYLFNLGSRRDKLEGFYLDLETGEFLSLDDAEARREKGGAGQVDRYNLFVRLTQNALFVYPQQLLQGVENREEVELSLAYALKRGLEALFQVEESELAVELVGQGEHRAFLFLEEAEGGLGVLRRLLEDPGVLAQVAQEALKVLHFSDGKDGKPDCTRACYECLLSYNNQPVAHLLNRFAIKGLLEALSQAKVVLEAGGPQEDHYEELLNACQSELERRFLRFLKEKGLRLPDEAQYRVAEAHTVADFLYRPNVLVYVDGPHHEEERQRRIDARQREALLDLGYRVLVVPYDADLESLLREGEWRDVVGTPARSG